MPQRTFASEVTLGLRSVDVRACARRGWRHASSAHGGAVFAARRLRCAARPEVAPHNSLRSLRSLRSNRCGESDDEARSRAPTSGLRCSPLHIEPTPHAASREGQGLRFPCRAPRRLPQWRARAGGSEPVGRRGAQGSWPRAQRAPCSDSLRLFDHSERSERRELHNAATNPSTAGQSVYPPTAPPARWRLPGCDFAAPHSTRSAQRGMEPLK